MKHITVQYYARLREAFGHNECRIASAADNIGALYRALCAEHGVTQEESAIRPILNDAFADWDDAFSDGDAVGFLPPASGG